jgi:hypothetical protein
MTISPTAAALCIAVIVPQESCPNGILLDQSEISPMQDQ